MTSPLVHTVSAFNTAQASENKIHDDAVAARFGFTGGLVPGVEVFAYATHVPLAHYGPTWLENGRMAMRFVKPVYDGRLATVTGEVKGAALTLSVESDGQLCAEGDAVMAAPVQCVVRAYREPPPPAARPAADATSLALHTVLSTRPRIITPNIAEDYLTAVRETAPLYRDADVIHPGLLLRACNAALVENVVLAPWIHVGSKVHLFSIGRVGEAIEARAEVIATYERKGHHFVDLDIVVLAGGLRPLARVVHTAIYRLRS